MKADDPYVDWLLETFEWLVRERGGSARCLAMQHLVTPTEEDFPVDAQLEGLELAESYFALVREHSQVTGLGFVLELVDTANSAEVLRGVPHPAIEAPRSIEDAEPVRAVALPIPVSLADLNDPIRLVAGMAHSVAHYYVQSTRTPHPGGRDAFRYTVDVTSVFFGFGIFAANVAKRFEQHRDGHLAGWSMRRFGALSELELSYALTAFCELHELDPKQIDSHLSTNPRAYFRQGLKQLRKRRPEIERLRSLGAEGSPYRTDVATRPSAPNRPPRIDPPPDTEIDGIRCPRCAWVPHTSSRWACRCGCRWNTFQTHGVCPSCHHEWQTTSCLDCKAWSDHDAWYVAG